ncbi:MAG: sulfite exporter TauE/SafE family protein [Nitrososphaeraceae archaeon]
MTFIWGIVAGIVGSMLGLGGGFIVSPILTLIGLPPSQVSQTSLFAVVSTGASSTVSFSLKKKVSYTNGIQIAMIALPFAIIGALVSSTLNQNDFRLYFAIILVLTSIYLLIRKPIAENHHTRIQRKILSNILFYCGSSAAGFISSIFGIGGGIIIVPILSVIKNLSMQESVATSQLSILIIAIAGILMHLFLAQPDYILIGSLSLGAIIGAQIGSFIATRISNRMLTMIYSGFLIIISIRFVFDYFL